MCILSVCHQRVINIYNNKSINFILWQIYHKRFIISYANIMDRPKVYVTRPDVPIQCLQLLRQKFDVTTWSEECAVPRQELLENVKGKDGLFCILTDKIDKELLDNAGPSLKVIGTMSVGYDHIDLAEVRKRDIKLGFTPDVLTDAVAELTLALLLATSRRLFESHQQILNNDWGAWSPLWMCGQGLKDSTIGIVGFGRIGQEVAKRLKCFKVAKILYTSRSKKEDSEQIGATQTSLDELLNLSDFVIVTCALTPETKEMFNDNIFAKMKHNAIFINTSRGGVVDQDALERALVKGTILAAGLDVMTPEPLQSTHSLLKLKNCVILPHIGSATFQARRDMAILTAQNIISGLEGQPMPAQL